MVLEQTEGMAALEAAKRAGKVRAMAYSGENDDLAWAAKGPLDAAWVAELQAAFVRHDQEWTGQI